MSRGSWWLDLKKLEKNVSSIIDKINVYTETVESIHVHKYGAYIFHTNNTEVWNYITQFATFKSSEWKPGDEPYYPVNDEKNLLYMLSIKNLQKQKIMLSSVAGLANTNIMIWMQSLHLRLTSARKSYRFVKLNGT